MCSQFVFPKPRDWETLEDIIADLLKRRYQSPNVQRFGRRGQKQFGIDIVGPTKLGMIGVQCKHHVDQNIPISEINDAITKVSESPVPLSELIIATSASRDNKAHSHILSLAKRRERQGECPVSIFFWEDIVEWLEEFPDLLYKHFTRYFPSSSFEHVRFSDLTTKKNFVRWPTTSASLYQVALDNLGGLAPVEPYQLGIGVTDFPRPRFAGLVDIEVQLDQYSSEESAQANFHSSVEILDQFRTTLSTPNFSRELLVSLQTRLTNSFLFGWMFRRVIGFSPQFVVGNELWATDGLPSTRSGLFDMPPVLLAGNSREVALVLSLSRHIGRRVSSTVHDWPQKPGTIVELRLESNSVRSAAHALGIAKEVSWRIKTYADQWQAERLHLFAAMPTSLASLVTCHLNAICPIDLYFLDSKRTRYLRAGTITNDLGGVKSWEN